MRRRPWFRVAALLSALWATVGLIEPAGYHACPMHGDAAAHHVTEATTAGHHDHGADGTPEQPSQEGGACLCLGDCTPGASGVQAPDAPAVHVATTPAEGPPRWSLPRVPVTRTGLLLPFANGPPVTA